VEHLNDKSATGCNISTYLGLVSNTTKRDALERTCFEREREREREKFFLYLMAQSQEVLINNDSERGADDNGFAEGGVWEADRWDRSLLTGSSAATFRACLPT